jgi:hypothetical protein
MASATLRIVKVYCAAADPNSVPDVTRVANCVFVYGRDAQADLSSGQSGLSAVAGRYLALIRGAQDWDRIMACLTTMYAAAVHETTSSVVCEELARIQKSLSDAVLMSAVSPLPSDQLLLAARKWLDTRESNGQDRMSDAESP